MMTRHRIRVVAAGLLVMASLSLLPVTSGAVMVKWGEAPVYPAGDPDQPCGSNILIKLPFTRYSLMIAGMRSASFVAPILLVVVPTSHAYGARAGR